MVLTSVRHTDSGIFSCIASNGLGKAASASASLNVTFAPKIVHMPKKVTRNCDVDVDVGVIAVVVVVVVVVVDVVVVVVIVVASLGVVWHVEFFVREMPEVAPLEKEREEEGETRKTANL